MNLIEFCLRNYPMPREPFISVAWRQFPFFGFHQSQFLACLRYYLKTYSSHEEMTQLTCARLVTFVYCKDDLDGSP